jgi:hypothetical protein
LSDRQTDTTVAFIYKIVQVEEVKIYPAAIEALREKERHHGT